MELADEFNKSSESAPEGLENLLNKSSEPDLEPIHARIKAGHKQQIETLAENSGFHSQASVIREALRIALPKIRGDSQ